ncbi:MAG: hypothetical protein FJ056_07240 [Cyanobacteria bacterium M_surface_10_m2_179]|nr:hypothetical protein [Cyanobacteria bacterium M_surface_10_m2_179]
MSMSFSNPRLVCFHDRLAPYRGSWVIYAQNQGGRYAACHELLEQEQPLRVLESRQLDSILEARRFTTHLILHGWSPEVIQPEQGYSVIGA